MENYDPAGITAINAVAILKQFVILLSTAAETVQMQTVQSLFPLRLQITVRTNRSPESDFSAGWKKRHFLPDVGKSR